MNFEFATSSRIIFGPGRFSQLADIALPLGQKVFVVTGRLALAASGRLDALKKALTDKRLEFFHFAVSAEPEIESVGLAAARAREEKCDMVIGVGGGSAIDVAKTVSGLLTNEGNLLDYLEVVGRGQTLRRPAAPLIAVPTTAGTGAEVTANAVIKDPATRQKVSLRSPYLLPRIALVDPELTYSLSPKITAQGGLDALVHLVEAYTSKRVQPVTDLFCADGISRIGHSLLGAYVSGLHKAREDMAMASLEGGIALANAGLGAVHGIAAVLGGAYAISHGMACACLLPHVLDANIQRLRSQGPNDAILLRYSRVFEWLIGKRFEREDEAIELGIAFIKDLNGHIGVPPLAQFGVREDDVPGIAARSSQASSTKANPVTLSQDELSAILKKALT